MQRRPKILVIDDDPDFVEATRLILETKPYQVITAVNGDDGLRKVSVSCQGEDIEVTTLSDALTAPVPRPSNIEDITART